MRVTKNLELDDIKIIKLLNIEKECSDVSSYLKEINCIKKIKQSQLDLIVGEECIDSKKFINLGSLNILEQNIASCFDRYRIIEQTLKYYGFKVRHFFLINITSNFLELFNSQTPTHSVTDVFTSKGWLGVDSNDPFITISEGGTRYSYKQGIASGLTKKYSDNILYDFPTFHIVGGYSRNGKFLKPYLPFVPEINFSDFVYNLNTMKFVFPKEIYN